LQMIFLGVLFMLQAILIFTLVAVCAEAFGKRILTNVRIMRYVQLVKAGVFALIGIRLALAEK
jgi:threonine/homoserine/homoserine lactone efflux protein